MSAIAALLNVAPSEPSASNDPVREPSDRDAFNHSLERAERRERPEQSPQNKAAAEKSVASTSTDEAPRTDSAAENEPIKPDDPLSATPAKAEAKAETAAEPKLTAETVKVETTSALAKAAPVQVESVIPVRAETAASVLPDTSASATAKTRVDAVAATVTKGVQGNLPAGLAATPTVDPQNNLSPDTRTAQTATDATKPTPPQPVVPTPAAEKGLTTAAEKAPTQAAATLPTIDPETVQKPAVDPSRAGAIEPKGPKLEVPTPSVSLEATPKTPQINEATLTNPTSGLFSTAEGRAEAVIAQIGAKGGVPTISTQQQAQVFNQLIEAVRIKAADQKISVRLDPPELGTVTIDLTFDKSKLVTATLATDQPETNALLRRNLDALQKELAEAGFEGVSIDLSNDKPQPEYRSAQELMFATDSRSPIPMVEQIATPAYQAPQILTSERIDLRL